MNPSDTKPLSNTQRALQELRRMIFTGELSAGSDHLETELADQLGMSRTPVREAALILDRQGLVALRPRKGVRILPVSPEDMSEIYDILTELESLAARDAAHRDLTETDLAPMGDAIDRMEDALAHHALEDWALADDQFHAELVRLGGNRRVRMIVGMMSDQVRRARTVTLYMRPLPTRSNRDHSDVLDAIRVGDGNRAASIHRAHRQHAKQVIIDLLEQHRLHCI